MTESSLKGEGGGQRRRCGFRCREAAPSVFPGLWDVPPGGASLGIVPGTQVPGRIRSGLSVHIASTPHEKSSRARSGVLTVQQKTQ